ncbi:YgcG family protein [Crenobacter sp. SG2303]|uniref:YgcG family protein n=1 Tax=Crenobacter oryzisoli TaxID=3056844 RepID=A0ABT7XV71_9NEIS|nr:YgcG family protein [Crenobacter sp. SG2303]MDN0077681.1 YgcG family protein [Crenobacter sp. SG2303]
MTAFGAARVLFASAALVWSLVAGAQQIAVPPLKAHVTDQTDTLTQEQLAALEQKLQSLEAAKGSQLAVLILPSTGEESIEQYSLRVVEQWKLGRKKVDDGALLIVAKDDHALRIEVGYGLEGALNDVTCKRIISEIIVPRLQQGDFYGGINAGVDRMIRVVNGEPLPAPARPDTRRTGGLGHALPVIFVLLFVVGGVLRALLGRLPAAIAVGGGAALLAWLLVGALSVAIGVGLVAFVFTLLGGGIGRLGGWQSGGGFGGGGLGGGGFSGGGGDFGGGGASGRW